MVKTGILLICVGQYDQFLHPMLNSIEKYWTHDKEIFLFTDKETQHKGVTQFKIPFQKFPSCSMFRYHYFNQVKDYFKDCDYLYYVDVDARFVDYVGDEILGDLVAVQHCGFALSGGGSFEENGDSCLFLPKKLQHCYFGGGFQGGSKKKYLHASDLLAKKITHDINRAIIPIHHDETAWNWYINMQYAAGGTKPVELTPEYHYPENDEYFSLNCWNGEKPWKPKLLLLEKDHATIR